MLGLVIEQLVENIIVFVQQWAREEVIFGQGEEINNLVEDPSASERYL